MKKTRCKYCNQKITAPNKSNMGKVINRHYVTDCKGISNNKARRIINKRFIE